MHRIVIFVLYFTFVVSAVFSQDTLHASRHLPRRGDVLRSQPLADRPSLNDGGQQQCWSIEGLGHAAEPFKVKYENTADSSLIVRTGHNTQYHYRSCGDSLIVCGFENNASKVSYIRPLSLLRFPMQYGDGLAGVYGGRGRLYDRQRLSVVGRYHTCLDGTGMLILPDGDTLRHVLRVRCVQQERDITRDIHTDGKRLGVDTLVVVKETLLWYAMGYRYPVLERICTDVLAEQPARYISLNYIAPEEQRALEYDEENERVRQQLTQEDFLSGADSSGSILSYRFSRHGDGQYITIDYDLAEGGTVEFVLCDTHGIVYRSLSRTQTAGEGYSVNISYAGLTRGQYVLYIRMNAEQYSEKFNVR